jgi:hypothetical protein
VVVVRGTVVVGADVVGVVVVVVVAGGGGSVVVVVAAAWLLAVSGTMPTVAVPPHAPKASATAGTTADTHRRHRSRSSVADSRRVPTVASRYPLELGSWSH